LPITAYKRRAEGIRMEGERFLKLDLRSMKAFGSTWTDCVFDECQLDLADLRSSKFVNCVFRNCALRLVNFGTSFFEGTKFTNCDMEQASLSGCHIRDGFFGGCRMAYGDSLFLDATVKGQTDFVDCNFHGSNLDFREADAGALRFSACNFWGARFSMGCAFWTGHFDARAVRQFVALVAKASQDDRLKDYAGEQYGVICRAMDGRKSPETAPVVVETEG